MQLHNQSLLEALGCKRSGDRWSCPLHGDGATLCTRDDGDGGTVFDCSHPACRFFGDAVALAAAAKKMLPQDAVSLFRAGGTLAHTLKQPLTDAEASAYYESKAAQSRIQAYLSACQLNLRRTPDRARFRMGVSQNTLRSVPQELGLLVRGDGTPPLFREFNKQKYAKANHVVYPYTYNGEVTHVRVQDVSSAFATVTVPVTRPDLGVFMERFDAVPETLVVVTEPRAAALVYGNCMAETSIKPPVVAAAGFPLPDSLRTVKTLYLLSTADAPISLEQALAIFGAECWISGASHQPRIRMWEAARPAERVTADDVRRRIQAQDTDSPELDAWIVKRLSEIVAAGNKEEAYRIVSAAALSDAARTVLSRTRAATPAVIEILASVSTASSRHLVLGNGRLLKMTATGLKALTRKGEEEVLSNFSIDVSHRIRTYDGNDVLVCTAAVADPAVPPVTVQFTETARARAATVQRAVAKAFAVKGAAPYVAAYDRKDYDWGDVFCRLAAGCDMHHEVKALGLDGDGDIHFPAAVVRTRTAAVTEQRQIFTMPEHTLRAYGGIAPGAGLSPCEPFRYLLERCDNLYVAAFTHGLMHVLHTATVGLAPGTVTKAPRHLLYVETEAGLWLPVFGQLSTLFSGDDAAVNVSYTDPMATVNDYRELGTLPLLARIPALRGDKFPRLIMESPVNLVGLTDSATATLSAGDLRTTFIAPCSDNPEPACVIAPSDIEDMRAAFPGFLAEFTARVPFTPAYRDATVPSQAAYEAVCNLLHVPASSVMSKIARKYFPSIGMTGANTFFDRLHAVLNAPHKKTPVCIVRGAPPADGSFTARGQHIFVMDDVVVISHTVVGLINKDSDTAMRFDHRLLTEELNERGLLTFRPEWLQVDTNRCWIMKREDWDLHVVRPPLLLPRLVTPGNVIRLNRIA